MNSPTDNYSTMIELHDVADNMSDAAINYAAGARKYALIEVTNSTKNYATNVSVLTLTNGLRCFDCQDDIRKIRIIHNVTGSTITYAGGSFTCPFINARLVQSWDETTLNALTVSSGSTVIPSFTIPAHGNIMIINSNVSNDHVLGYYNYSDKFTAAPNAISPTQ